MSESWWFSVNMSARHVTLFELKSHVLFTDCTECPELVLAHPPSSRACLPRKDTRVVCVCVRSLFDSPSSPSVLRAVKGSRVPKDDRGLTLTLKRSQREFSAVISVVFTFCLFEVRWGRQGGGETQSRRLFCSHGSVSERSPMQLHPLALTHTNTHILSEAALYNLLSVCYMFVPPLSLEKFKCDSEPAPCAFGSVSSVYL